MDKLKFLITNLLFIFLFKLVISRIISIPYTYHNGLIAIKEKLGNESKVFYKYINQGNKYTFSTNSYWDDIAKIDIDSTLSRELRLNYGVYSPTEHQGEIMLETNDKITINIIKVNFESHRYQKYYDSIGLGYSAEHDKYFFIYQLYKQKIIDKLQFAIAPASSKDNEQFLYFGGIPDEILMKYSNRSYCNTEQGRRRWNCNFTSVFYKSNNGSFVTFSNTNYSFFYSMEPIIRAPKYFFNYLKENFFKEALEKGLCLDNGSIQCQEEAFYNLPKYLYFVFGEFYYLINVRDLFTIIEKTYFFNIKPSYADLWIIGDLFLRRYLIEYNYDKNIIVFYEPTDQDFTIFPLNELVVVDNFTIKLLSILVLIICGFSCSLLVYLKIVSLK